MSLPNNPKSGESQFKNSNEITVSFIWSKRTLSLRIFLAGGIAGAVSRTVTAPLDRIKVLMQASHGEDTLKFIGSAKKIYREGGVRGYWKGNGVNCVKLFPETAIRFYVYEFLRARLNIDTEHADIATRFVTGSAAGLVSQTIVYPLEVIKTRMALSQPGLYRGVWDVVVQTVSREGALGLYKGMLASMLGIIPYSGVELMVYSYLTDHFTRASRHKGVGAVLACGAVSSMCGQTIAYPFQLVRTKLQAQGMPVPKELQGKVHYKQYSGVGDCIKKIVQKRGFLGLYRGIMANYMKAIPAISVKYMMYELLKEWFRVGDKMTSA